MFELYNPPAFQYFSYFVAIYGITFIGSISLKLYRSRIDKNRKHLKRIINRSARWFAFFSIFGFFLLFARYAYIYFFSMEFLQIMNLCGIILTVIFFSSKLIDQKDKTK